MFRELSRSLHWGKGIWIQRLLIPSNHPQLHVPGSLACPQNVDGFHRVVILQTTMAQEANPSTGQSLKMRPSRWSMLALVSGVHLRPNMQQARSQWPTQGLGQMDPSFSSARRKPLGWMASTLSLASLWRVRVCTLCHSIFLNGKLYQGDSGSRWMLGNIFATQKLNRYTHLCIYCLWGLFIAC